MRHLHVLAWISALLPVAGAAQQAVRVGADVRITTMAGQVIRGQVIREDSATFSVSPREGKWSEVTTPRDSVALLEIREAGRLRPAYLLMGAAAGAAGGGMIGATVAWMECPLGEGVLCSAHGRRYQMRAVAAGIEIGAVAGVVAGFFFRPGHWQSVPNRARPAVTRLSRGLGVGVHVPF